jgi:hypothetical protein
MFFFPLLVDSLHTQNHRAKHRSPKRNETALATDSQIRVAKPRIFTTTTTTTRKRFCSFFGFTYGNNNIPPTTMMKSSTAILLLVSLLRTAPSSAFSVSPNSVGRQASSSSKSSLLFASTIDSRLFYRDNGDFDNNDILPAVSPSSSLQSVAVSTRALTDATTPLSGTNHGLSPLEVPARSSSSDDYMLQDSSVVLADQIEITLGRLAMVAGLIFLGTELITGQSLPQQIVNTLSL